jgi:hypothetical protein
MLGAARRSGCVRADFPTIHPSIRRDSPVRAWSFRNLTAFRSVQVLGRLAQALRPAAAATTGAARTYSSAPKEVSVRTEPYLARTNRAVPLAWRSACHAELSGLINLRFGCLFWGWGMVPLRALLFS